MRRKGHTFEVMQRFSETHLGVRDVREAGGEVLHPVAVHFKGKGFYNTDYGTRSAPREAKENETKASSESSRSGTIKELSKSTSESSSSESSSTEDTLEVQGLARATPRPPELQGRPDRAADSSAGRGPVSVTSPAPGGRPGRRDAQPFRNFATDD